MELYNSGNAPHIPEHVRKAIARFDPNLRITWSEYAIEKTVRGAPLPKAQYRPRHHIWLKIGEGTDAEALAQGRMRYLFCLETPERDRGLPPTVENIVGRIKGDLARLGLSDATIEAASKRMHEDREKRRKKAMDDYTKDYFDANGKLFLDAALNDVDKLKKTGVRDGKIMSYPGQTDRSTPGEVPKSDKELGLEQGKRPDLKKIK